MSVGISRHSSKEQMDTPPLPSVPSDAETKIDEFSLLDLLIVLAERKRLIFCITIATAIIATVVAFVLPKRYTATVTLLPPQQNSSMGAALVSQLGGMGGMAALAGGGLLKNPNDMYVAMLKSRTVEDAMVLHFGLMQEYHTKYISDCRKAFEGHTKVDGNGKDGLIHISVTDADPRRASDLANGYLDQYRDLSQHLAITEASQRRLFFEQQLEQAKDKLENAEEKLKNTQQKTGMIQPAGQAGALIQSAVSLRAQIEAKQVEIQSLRLYATGENPQLVTAEKELQSLRTELAKLGGSESGTEAELLIPRGQVSEAALQYLRAEREVKYYETIFEILARQFEIAKLDEAKQGAAIQVVDAAIPPDRRSSPRRGLIVIGATAIGFFLGVFTALLFDLFQRMQSSSETARKLHLLRSNSGLHIWRHAE